MTQILEYSPGQKITLFLDTKNSDGYYADGYYSDGYSIDGYESPVLYRMINPDFSLNQLFPQAMTKFATGLYYIEYTLPSGAAAVGSYFIDIAYREPDTYLLKFQSYNIIVNAPFGLYSVTSF